MDSEVIPLPNCEVMYQAAVSKRADNTIPSGVLYLAHGHVMSLLQHAAIMSDRAAHTLSNYKQTFNGQFYILLSCCLKLLLQVLYSSCIALSFCIVTMNVGVYYVGGRDDSCAY